jgi:dipeptidyl aminopeptidase/acylaminoacyl peptidase
MKWPVSIFLFALVTPLFPGSNFLRLKEMYMEARLKLTIEEIENRCANEEECVRTVPLKDFFRNPEVEGFKISPDGQKLSFLAPWENRMNIFVIERKFIGQALIKDLPEDHKKQLTFIKERDISSYFWKGNETIVYIRDFGGDENFHLFATNALSGKEIDLTPFDGVKADVIDDLEDHEDEMIIGMNKRDEQVFDAYRINVRSGEMQMIATNPGNVMSWMTDHDGNIRMASQTDGVNTTLLYRETGEGDFQSILTTNFRESVNPLFFTFDNKKIYVSSNLGRDKSSIAIFDPKSAREEEVLFEHPVVDVSSLSYSRKEKRLISASYTKEKQERKFFHEEWKKMHASLSEKLPGLEIAITGMDREEENLIVRTYSDRSLGKTYLYERKTSQMHELEDFSSWINPAEMAPQIPIEYKARDGLMIPGYLTLPLRGKLKNLPVVVNPHGGPWARDAWGYNPQVQFLANRGYAVLQMNFRGSTGYGREFWESSFKKWGLEMQDDITDGVQWLIDKGIADPSRIAIYGASYGGYAVLAGLSFTPELYACGIDYVGVSNLFTLMETIPPYWKPMQQMLYEMIGHPEHENELLKAASPVFHADKIKVPLLIAQGAKDPRVKKSESDQMVSALKERGIDVPYLVKENEGHGFQNEENRFEFYQWAETFLQKHLGNQ